MENHFQMSQSRETKNNMLLVIGGTHPFSILRPVGQPVTFQGQVNFADFGSST